MNVAFAAAAAQRCGKAQTENLRRPKPRSLSDLNHRGAVQAEPHRLWNAIVCNGEQESACGWCKDMWGLSWQITPRALTAAITDPDRAAAKCAFEAMMQMSGIDIAAIEAARRG